MKKTTTTTTIFFTSILAACGGGEGSSATKTNPNPAPPSFSLNLASNITQLDEKESGQITLSYKNANGDVTLAIDSSASGIPSGSFVVTENNSDQTVNVELGELTSNGTISFVITGTDGIGKTDSETISFPANNTSALPKIEQLEAMANAMSDLLEAKQERRILSTLIELGVMAKVIPYAVANTRIASIEDSFDADLKSSLQNYVESGNWRSNYGSSTISETHLDESIAYINQALNDYVAEVDTVLENTQNELKDVQVSSFAFDGFHINSSGMVSQFWGNPKMGSINSEGEWEFNSNYAFLTTLIFPETLTCNQD